MMRIESGEGRLRVCDDWAGRRRKRSHHAPSTSTSTSTLMIMSKVILLSLGLLLLCCAVVVDAVAPKASSSIHSHHRALQDDLDVDGIEDNLDNEAGAKPASNGMEDMGIEQVEASASKDELTTVETTSSNDEDMSDEEEATIANEEEESGPPMVIYDGLDAIAPGDSGEEGEEEITSDGAAMEETDVEEKAEELLKEGSDNMSRLEGQTKSASASATESATESKQEQLTSSKSSVLYPDTHRSAWVAHGAIGATVFGLLVPSAITSAFFRDLIPTYWIYIHVCVNVITFAMTFFTVGIAFATMNGMGAAGEGHLKEMHHIVGLLLLMLVSFQTANGFLRPPREFITDDEHDTTPGAILRSTMNEKSLTARTLWYLIHGASGLLIFGLGAYQVESGLGLFAKRFGATDWGNVYIGYIVWLSIVIVIAKLWMVLKERKRKKLEQMGIQMSRGKGSGSYADAYDAEDDFANAKFEHV